MGSNGLSVTTGFHRLGVVLAGIWCAMAAGVLFFEMGGRLTSANC
jgi:hypothetical protein